jgi:hypothetical protein|nr:MAG TPA: Loader and inhibitor of phage G40P [Caudoviricetes sp.]
MEQSKLISIVIAKFKIAYPYYFKDLTDEEFLGLVSLYQEELGIFHPIALLNAIKVIIRNNKFMPTLADIIDEYRKSLKNYYIEVIENSNPKNKKYLLDMVDWYSLHKEFPENIPNDVISDIKALNYNQIKEIEYKEVMK